jgi:hypothetical protein
VRPGIWDPPDATGEMYGSAREVATVLGYRRWPSFARVVQRAACASAASVDPAAHFRPSGAAGREPADGHLSRLALDLVVQSANRGSRSIWWYKAPIHGTSLSPKPKPILSVVQPQGKSLHQGQFFVGGGPAASGLGWHPKRVRLVRRAAAVVRTGANGSRSRDMSALRALGPKPAFFSYLASVNLLAFRPFSRSCPQF